MKTNALFNFITAIADGGRYASKQKFIDDIAKRFGNISDAKASFVRDKAMTAVKNGGDDMDFTSILTKIQKGDIAIPENIRRVIQTEHPFNHYSKWIDETNDVAKNLGFRDEADFSKYFSDLDLKKEIPVEDTLKLKGVFRYIKSYAKNHPGSVVKAAIAGGTLAYMVAFVQKFQAENTGCFRYAKNDKNNLVRYRFGGNFCVGGETDKDSDRVKILPVEEHPLFGVEDKWDCDYSQFEAGNPVVDDILNRGCNGLCDWLNFNILTGYVTGSDKNFQPLVLDDDNDYSMYIYKCEKATILRAMTSFVSDAVDETMAGFADSQLGKKTIDFLKSQMGQAAVFIAIFLLIIFLIYSASKFISGYMYQQQQQGKKYETVVQ